MADFNSSDIEISGNEKESSRIGSRAIASILQKSVEDRIESKKQVKKLHAGIANAPSTSIHRRYWHELFKQFACHTLHIERRSDPTPTGDDIARFLSQLPGHLQSKHDDGKLAWTMFKSAEVHLERALTFEHEGFRLSKRDALRLDATLQQLLNNGQITKDPVRESLWLSCQIVKKMVMAVFVKATVEGTKSWDTTLMSCLGLALQAALASRAGEIRRSAHYTGDEYLKWENIELIARGSIQDPKLSMLITVLYQKGQKREPGKAAKVELRQLDEQHNVVDITKLLVAYALRVGAVKERTWESLITAVIQRPSKRFIWETPTKPIFLALTKGERLDFWRPAGVDQQNRILRRAAEVVGMLQRPVSHDIRRGAAADVYSLKQPHNMEGARRSLGHSRSAMSKGMTDKYIGRTKGDMWEARIDNSTTAPDDPYGIQFAPESYKKRKIATKDIDNYCTTKGLDATNRKARDEARQALERIQHTQWAEHQQSLLNNDSASSVSTGPIPSGNESLVVAQKRAPLKDITNISQPPPETRDRDDARDFTGETEEPIVTELSHVLAIDNAVASDGPSQAVLERMSLEYTSMLASNDGHERPSVLTATIDEFIGFLSTINLISISTRGLPSDAESGNSRDEPSKFLFTCRKEFCTRSFDSALRRDQHEVNCNEAALSADEHNEHAMPKGRKRKRQDINKLHDGFPKPCPDSEICGVTKDFATKHLLDNHRKLHHDNNWPKEVSCNVAGCQLPRDHYFKSREAFRRHLSSYHLFDNTKAREYISKIVTVSFSAPRGTSASYLATMCLFPECKTTAEFATYSDYTTHLSKIHKLTAIQYPRYMPTSSTVRLHPRPELSTIDVSLPVERDFEAGHCTYRHCSSTTIYTDSRTLVDHLNVSHNIARSEAPKYFPGPEIAPFYGTKCLHPDCASKHKFFFERKLYTQHLKAVHKLSTVAEISSFQLWYKLKYGTTGMANE